VYHDVLLESAYEPSASGIHRCCRMCFAVSSHELICVHIFVYAAAGGRFRGRIGRTLFQTAGLFQSVLEPDIATNKVSTEITFHGNSSR
jgi:hypothetical protein